MALFAGAGHSSVTDAYQAGRAAAENAAVALKGHPPRLIIAFTTDQYEQSEVLRGIRSVAGAAPLVGCCTGGLITAQGILPQGVATLALYSEDLDVTLAIEPGLSTQPLLAAERVGEQLEEHIAPARSGKHNLALVLTDGLTGPLTVDQALQTTADFLGPLCTMFGGSAGDSLRFEKTSLFCDDRVCDDAIAAALLTTHAHIGIGVRHGWQPIGQPLVITRNAGNLIYELDGRPAMDVYRELFPQSTITPENFREITRYHPIGFRQANGEFQVRLPLAMTEEGAIECLGKLPSHTIAHIMEGDPGSLVEAAELATRRALAGLCGQPLAAAIVFDCVTRPPLLGNQTDTEIARIRDVLGHDTPILGMYSLGEIAADEGPVCYHNKTVAVCAIGKG